MKYNVLKKKLLWRQLDKFKLFPNKKALRKFLVELLKRQKATLFATSSVERNTTRREKKNSDESLMASLFQVPEKKYVKEISQADESTHL